MKILLLVLLFFSTLYAEPLTINQAFVSQMSGAYQANIEDKEKNFTAEQILHDENITHYPKNFSSYSLSAFWSNFDIYNSSQKSIRIAIANLRAGTDKIDVYLYKNGVLTKTIYLGDMRPQEEREILAPKSVFYLSIDANETITLVSRFDSLGSYDMQWEVSTLRHYHNKNSLELLLWGLFGGVIFALIIYNLMMFYNLRKVIYLVYVVHAFLLLFFQFSLAGVFYFLDIGIDLFTLTLSTWFVGYFMLAALSLFTILFFELHIQNRALAWLVGITGIINSVIGCFYLYGFVDSSILLLSSNLYLLSIVLLLIIFSVGVYALYKGYRGAWYYVLGEGPYIAVLLYSSFSLFGKTATGPLLFLIPISVLIEIVFFSLALGAWVKKIKIENEKNNQLIMDEARFTSIGKSIGMVVHQWKEPLSQLASHILYVKAKEHVEKALPVGLKEHIYAMAEIIDHMKHSINDVYESCSNVKSFSSFGIHTTIELAMRFQKDNLTLSNAHVEIQCPKEITIYGSKNALINVFMTLIDNSLGQFKSNKTIVPKIVILVEESEKFVKIVFEDNGGGISSTPISDIFNIEQSDKGLDGSGIGLTLSKMLVEKRLNGSISVLNISNGACFTIMIPLQKISS